MSVLFLSHSTFDKPIAEILRQQLLAAGYSSVFIDNHDIRPGQMWEQVLYERLRAARAVVALLTPRFIESKWCFAEITHARSLGRPIIPAMHGECDIPGILQSYQSQSLGSPDAIQRIIAGLSAVGVKPHDEFDWDGHTAPYPGLESFDIRDAGVYFGREDEINRALDDLQDMAMFGGASALIIVGGSGTGKSSFLRAGILPRLEGWPGRWILIGPMRPGEKPFTLLKEHLAKADLALEHTFTEREFQTPDSRSARVLLVLDQLEEIASANEIERTQFIDWVRSRIAMPEGLVVLATLRSDYLADLELLFPEITAASRTLALGKISEEGLLRAIERPASIAGSRLEDGLAISILQDIRDQQALPLLSFTLRVLWDRRSEGGCLTLKAYRDELGAVSGAVRRVASAALGNIPVPDVVAVRKSLLQMVYLSHEGRLRRRRVRRSALPPAGRAAVERLIAARLLVADADYVEPAHESLYETWQQLHDWVLEARDGLALRDEVEAAAAQWADHSMAPEYMWPRGRIERTESLLNGAQIVLPAEAEKFLAACWSHIREREAQELDRQVAEIKRLRRQRLVVSGLLIAAIVAAFLAALSRGRASRAARDAQAAHDRTTVELAAAVADQDPTQTLRILLSLPAESLSWTSARIVAADAVDRGVALEIPIGAVPRSIAFSPSGDQLAIGRDDGVVEVRSVTNLSQLRKQGKHKGQVSDVLFSTDGRDVLSTGKDGSVLHWNLDNNEVDEVAKCQATNSDSGLEYFLEKAKQRDRFVFGSTESCGITIIDLVDHRAVVHHTGPPKVAAWGGITLSPSGIYVAVRSSSKAAQIYETENGHFVRSLSFDNRKPHRENGDTSLRSVAFSFDDRFVVATASFGDRLVWELGRQDVRQFGEPSLRCSVNSETVFSPNSYTAVADADNGRMICVWRADNPEYSETLKFDRFERDTGSSYVGRRNIAFSASGTLVASPSETEDNTIRIWNLGTHQNFVLQGHRETVGHIAFSPDGSKIASASFDGTVRIWDIADLGRREITAPPPLSRWGRVTVGTRNPTAISQDGLQVAYASGGDPFDSEDNHVPLWNLADGKLIFLSGWKGWSGSASFDASAKHLAISSTEVTSSGTSRFATDTNLSVVDLDSQRVSFVGKHPAPFARVALSQDGRWLVSVGAGHLILWDLAGNTQVELTNPNWQCKSLEAQFASTTGKLMVVCDRRVRIMDVPGFAFREQTIDAPIGRFALAPGGNLFAVSTGQIVEIWNSDGTIKQLFSLRGHQAEIVALAFSSDGSQLVTSAKDSLWLWDTREGRGRRLEAPVFAPEVVGFLHDRRISGAGDTYYYLWNDKLPKEPASLRNQMFSIVRPDLLH
jgi:WD40 repeat protein